MNSNVIEIGNICHTGSWGSPQTGRIYSTKGVSPCLNTCGGGNHEPKILVYEEQKEWSDL